MYILIFVCIFVVVIERKYTYRFKTKEEFLEEYGRDWREEVRCSWVEQMDWALGMNIENKIHTVLSLSGQINTYIYDMIDNLFDNNDSEYNFHFSDGHLGFNASIDMITKVQLSPNYNPKQFIY